MPPLYNRATDCDPCWIRYKKVMPAIGKWGRVPYCEDCKRDNDIDDDDVDWVVFDTTNAMPKPGDVDYAEVTRRPEPVEAAAPAPAPRLAKPDGICTRTAQCNKPFGHTGRCPKNAPKVPKAPKETWQVPGSSTETPKAVQETKLAAASRIGKEIREGLGGKARHARGEEQKPAAWALQFRELSDDEYAAIVPQRFLQKELEPIVEAIHLKQTALMKANCDPKVRIVIDVPHHTNSRHFRDRVSRYMRLRKVNSHTEQVARTNQIIVTAPPEKLPWGTRANGKQAT